MHGLVEKIADSLHGLLKIIKEIFIAQREDLRVIFQPFAGGDVGEPSVTGHPKTTRV